MEDKALLQILVDMLSYYKHQARMLVWVVVIVLVMHLATVIGFLYYESQFETVSTTTTTQTVDGKDNDIVNGDKVTGNYKNGKPVGNHIKLSMEGKTVKIKYSDD
jgi:hypothetical protein